MCFYCGCCCDSLVGLALTRSIFLSCVSDRLFCFRFFECSEWINPFLITFGALTKKKNRSVDFCFSLAHLILARFLTFKIIVSFLWS